MDMREQRVDSPVANVNNESPFYKNPNHSSWSLSIECNILEVFVIVAKCKQDSKVLTHSSFTGTKMHVNGVYAQCNSGLYPMLKDFVPKL